MLDDASWCDKAIKWFEEYKDRQAPGVCSSGHKSGVYEDTKKSTDINVRMVDLKCNMFRMEENEDFFHPIFEELRDLFFEYGEKYETLMSMGELEIMPVFNMQKYVDGGHFKRHHFESSSRFTRHRVLVWMIYLNDVEKGGETFFPYINKRFKPKKGQMLIWPAEFTHTHAGEEVLKGHDKYIMTGWIGLIPSCINEINFNKLPKGVTLHGR
tara:strand:+ start:609 stop:1244 length:636 start_codon:yes stop_codon:yes gene_type:complete